ncbi:sce7726 family protein [Amycolatopsis sp. NPDC088138]|uniref:sce7726 family protein n=1 Tax=Amycolatopsis sp. NPDC088138 TaxID=3363938 RepID=UPI003815B435
MRDYDVRTALRARLLDEHAEHFDQTLLVDELGLCGEARVDVAVVNGSLTGYELKSASDRLDRLPNQVEIYGRVLDYAFLVVADVHLVRARTMLPAWWGIMVAKEASGSIVLSQRRKARMNPNIQVNSLVQLLWRNEALDILAHHGKDYGVRTKPRDAIWERLAQSLEIDQLRGEVRDKIRARRGWRENPVPRGSGETLRPSGKIPRFLARRLR